MLKAARSMRGAKFRLQGRNPRCTGVDCVGVIVCAYGSAGRRLRGSLDYRLCSRVSLARRELVANLGQRRRDRQDGDVLLFGLGRRSNRAHMGISDGDGFWHVEIGDVVCRQRFSGSWARAFLGAYGVR